MSIWLHSDVDTWIYSLRAAWLKSMWLLALPLPIRKQFQICHPVIICIIWVSFNSICMYSIAHFKPVEMCLSFSLPDVCQMLMSLHDTYPRLSDGDSCDMTLKYSLSSACGNHYFFVPLLIFGGRSQSSFYPVPHTFGCMPLHGPWQWLYRSVCMERPGDGNRGGRTLSGQCSATSSWSSLFGRFRRLSDRQQIHGWSDSTCRKSQWPKIRKCHPLMHFRPVILHGV